MWRRALVAAAGARLRRKQRMIPAVEGGGDEPQADFVPLRPRTPPRAKSIVRQVTAISGRKHHAVQRAQPTLKPTVAISGKRHRSPQRPQPRLKTSIAIAGRRHHAAQVASPEAAKGYRRLLGNITINNISVAPFLQLLGDEAAATWVPHVGATSFTIPTGTVAPTYNVAGAYGLGVDYKGNNNQYHATTGNAYGVGTDDFLYEAVVYDDQAADFEHIMWHGDASIIIQLSKRDIIAGRHMGFFIQNGGTNLLMTSTNSMPQGSYYHIVVACNRDENSTNGLLMYINGAIAATANANAFAALTLTPAALMGIAGRTGRVDQRWNGNIYYFSKYRYTNWFAAGAQCRTDLDAWVSARYTLLTT
jgi:hypothetical protein